MKELVFFRYWSFDALSFPRFDIFDTLVRDEIEGVNEFIYEFVAT